MTRMAKHVSWVEQSLGQKENLRRGIGNTSRVNTKHNKSLEIHSEKKIQLKTR